MASGAITKFNEIRDRLSKTIYSEIDHVRELYSQLSQAAKADRPALQIEIKTHLATISTLNNHTRAIIKDLKQNTDDQTNAISDDRKLLASTGNNLDSQLEAIQTKNTQFLSAQHLGVEVNRLYRRQKKIMWIYIILLIILVSASIYLFVMSYNSWGGESASLISTPTYSDGRSKLDGQMAITKQKSQKLQQQGSQLSNDLSSHFSSSGLSGSESSQQGR
jgi:hypothetical protein